MAETPEAIGVFKPETARKILQATQAWERSPTAVGLDESPVGRLPIVFRNNSGHEIPPYGLMQCSGEFQGTVSHVNVDRPFVQVNVSSVPLVNGPVAVPDGKFGTAQNGPVYRVVHDASVTYEPGDRIGWKTDSFLATLGCVMTILGKDEVVENCVKAMIDHTPIIGTASSSISVATEGYVVVDSGVSGTKTHKAKTVNGTILTGASVILMPVRGKWIALEICS